MKFLAFAALSQKTWSDYVHFLFVIAIYVFLPKVATTVLRFMALIAN